MEINREHVEHYLFSLPDDGWFNYGDCFNCFVASFLKTVQRRKPNVGSVTVSLWDEKFNIETVRIPDWLINLLWNARRYPGYDGKIYVSWLRSAYLEMFPDTLPINPRQIEPEPKSNVESVGERE